MSPHSTHVAALRQVADALEREDFSRSDEPPPLLERVGQGFIVSPPGERPFALNDCLGLRYLQILIEHPGVRHSCTLLIELVRGVDLRGTAGQVYEAAVDGEAARQFRAALAATDDPAEREHLRRELAAAGRRGASGDGKRQANSVGMAIRSAMEVLGRFSRAAWIAIDSRLRVGTSCEFTR